MSTTLQGADLRPRRRHPRRPPAQGGDPRRIVGADSAARSARHPGQLRRRREGRIDARLGRHHRHGRDHLHGVGGAEPAALLQARVVRQVHAVPRRRRLAAQAPRRRSSAATGEMRDLDLLLERVEQHRRQDAVRVRRCRGDAGADHAEAVPRRVRGAHSRRPLHGAGRLARAHSERRPRRTDDACLRSSTRRSSRSWC